MHDNHVYNLLEQLVVEQKSLWRMKGDYEKDSADHPDCAEMWKELTAQKEENVKKLTEMVKKYL